MTWVLPPYLLTRKPFNFSKISCFHLSRKSSHSYLSFCCGGEIKERIGTCWLLHKEGTIPGGADYHSCFLSKERISAVSIGNKQYFIKMFCVLPYFSVLWQNTPSKVCTELCSDRFLFRWLVSSNIAWAFISLCFPSFPVGSPCTTNFVDNEWNMVGKPYNIEW